MESIKQWITCIIFSSLICAIVSVLSPKGSSKRALQTVLAVFLISAFLSPFLSGGGVEFDFELPDFADYQSSLTSQITDEMSSQVENEVREETEELLKSIGVEYKNIEVESGVNESNQIYIKKITLTMTEKYLHREKQITSNLKSMFDTEAKFIWVKE